MVVNVKNIKGIRYGDFEIQGIKGRFPVQAITSTNFGHAKFFHQPNFDFKTTFHEIFEVYPDKILKKPEYRKSRAVEISKIIEQNADKLCLLVLNRTKEKPITRMQNHTLINFQIACGFKLIKAFFMDETNALKNSREYRNMMPLGSSLVVVLDENLDPSIFKDLYNDAYKIHKDQVIGFLGREPSEKNENNKLNFIFLRKRKKDRVIRLVSLIRKSMGGVVGSLIYHLQGLDVYSFAQRFGPPNVPIVELQALQGFRYVPLTKNTNCICVITGTNLYDSSLSFKAREKSSLPINVHNIVRLNEEFENIQKKYTRRELEVIVREFLV